VCAFFLTELIDRDARLMGFSSAMMVAPGWSLAKSGGMVIQS
jgi:hypothetical protein